MSETTRAANTMEIGLGGLGEVEVDDDVDGLDVDTTSDEIGTDKVAAVSLAEVVEDAVTMLLLHAGVDVVAGVTELGDLAGEELDAVDGVAEDDGLVDLELVEEGVEAVDLLAFFDEGVELGDTLEGELVHEVDLVGVLHVLVGEVLDGQGEGGGEEERLAALERRDIAVDLIHELGEFGAEKLVGLIEDNHAALVELGGGLGGEIGNTSGGGDEDVDGAHQAHDIVAEGGTTGGDHDFEAADVLAEFLGDLGGLERELTGGNKEKGLNGGDFSADLLEDGDDERSGLAGSVFGAGEDVFSGEGDGDGFLLNGGRLFETLFEDAHE